MKTQIRRGCFETNSSSVHSIQMMNIQRQPNKMRICKDNKIKVSCGAFGKERCAYTDQKTKLSYLITLLAYTSHAVYGGDVRDIYDTYDFELLNKYISEYCNCDGIRIEDLRKAEIDHQSMPEGDWINFIDMYNKDKVLDFIFSEDLALVTDCD